MVDPFSHLVNSFLTFFKKVLTLLCTVICCLLDRRIQHANHYPTQHHDADL